MCRLKHSAIRTILLALVLEECSMLEYYILDHFHSFYLLTLAYK